MWLRTFRARSRRYHLQRVGSPCCISVRPTPPLPCPVLTLTALFPAVQPDDIVKLRKRYMADGGAPTPTQVVLLQELERWNLLVIRMSVSLTDLSRALVGEIGMSDALEDVGNALFNGFLPSWWRQLAPATQKSLGRCACSFSPSPCSHPPGFSLHSQLRCCLFVACRCPTGDASNDEEGTGARARDSVRPVSGAAGRQ